MKDIYSNVKSNDYEVLVKENAKKLFEDELGFDNCDLEIESRLKRIRGKKVAVKLNKDINFKGKKVLEVGSGWGEVSYEISKYGANVVGLEPNPELLNISKKLILIGDSKISGNIKFVKGFGEKLPFKNKEFDVVISTSVIEHVDNVEDTLNEMLRVCKEGGIIYITCPNYLFPMEAHYGIFYPPLVPKFLGKFYLRLRGRPDSFIKHINYVTQRSISKKLKKFDLNVRDYNIDYYNSLDFGFKKFFWFFLLKINLNPNIDLLIRKK
ncbi:MAG: class I SAM-dependent methyltransferase [Nanoarchaeota archaeon]|nr:class I SAM-dependent methyltransferase [Nanoarchaeota archaeon]